LTFQLLYHYTHRKELKMTGRRDLKNQGDDVIKGTGAPADTLGVSGQMYIDTAADLLYGPKHYVTISGVTTETWGPPVNLQGPTGPSGASGATGATGATGVAGTGVYGMFYRNPVAGYGTGAIDAAIPFDSNGPANGITRFSATEITLAAIGTYDVSWMVSVDEAGQLAAFVDNGSGYAFHPETLAGRATGTNQITNRVLITTTGANAKLKIVNHSSPAALTLTPLPGGTSAGSTSLVIVKL